MCFQIVCLPNSCQNALNHSKLAHKRPKRSNSTKIETRVKTSKSAVKFENLEVIFVTKYHNKNLFKKKTDFCQSREKTP